MVQELERPTNTTTAPTLREQYTALLQREKALMDELCAVRAAMEALLTTEDED